MKHFIPGLAVVGFAWFSARAEVSFQPVALSGQVAPGLTNNITFSGFNYLSLADDGRIAFTANISGPGVSSTNNLGLWAGLPGGLGLIVRTGDPFPEATNGGTFVHLFGPNIDNHQAVGFCATDEAFDAAVGKAYGVSMIAGIYPLGEPESVRWIFPKNLLTDKIIPAIKSLLGFAVTAAAGRAELLGEGIGQTNDLAIIGGPSGNPGVIAQKGSPAPGVAGHFTFFPLSSQSLALTPDGNVAFMATASGVNLHGIWFGQAGTLQAVGVPNGPAPPSLLGPGYTVSRASSENVEVNARGELAFATLLSGPGLNSTNSDFVVAGTPDALRVIAQMGQPAPGIPGAFFRSYFNGGPVFSHVLLGADGAVAFEGCYSDSGWDFGLWLAPTNGTTPILLMRNGQQAPGAPVGVMFTNSFQFLPPFEQVFMNSRNQIVFRARLGGPGIGPDDFGIWLAEPNGTVSLIARTGDMMDIGGGVMRQISNVTFGVDPEFIAGSEDGRRSPFNDRGEVALWITLTDSPGSGLFIARTGIVLSGERMGNDILIKFPTLAGKHYRVDYRTNMTETAWSVFAASVDGTGAEVSVTNANAIAIDTRFFRVVRLD